MTAWKRNWSNSKWKVNAIKIGLGAIKLVGSKTLFIQKSVYRSFTVATVLCTVLRNSFYLNYSSKYTCIVFYPICILSPMYSVCIAHPYCVFCCVCSQFIRCLCVYSFVRILFNHFKYACPLKLHAIHIISPSYVFRFSIKMFIHLERT